MPDSGERDSYTSVVSSLCVKIAANGSIKRLEAERLDVIFVGAGFCSELSVPGRILPRYCG